ncbi:MAG: hypothetical protein K8H88_34015 [Sandaracinaceae bacterium]|nr:hypothetical protein [Sandaracinaceae bacterium]
MSRTADVGRRGALVDGVLPEVPVRQWVCSLPWSLRVASAYDRRLAGGSSTSSQARSRARCERTPSVCSACARCATGSVTVVQRSDASLRLNWHLHVLRLDGVYVRDEQGVRFEPLGEAALEDVSALAERLLRGCRSPRRAAIVRDKIDCRPGRCPGSWPRCSKSAHGAAGKDRSRSDIAWKRRRAVTGRARRGYPRAP